MTIAYFAHYRLRLGHPSLGDSTADSYISTRRRICTTTHTDLTTVSIIRAWATAPSEKEGQQLDLLTTTHAQ
ncbi:hypothetical protein AB0F17_33005 [Nonomuraea sp. NPDC026600]|uniref:hypothetical protein n=1 Tax=Nonomuraea sp. NPDC026600 TaxID=3155363 RepID=UPI0033E473B2